MQKKNLKNQTLKTKNQKQNQAQSPHRNYRSAPYPPWL